MATALLLLAALAIAGCSPGTAATASVTPGPTRTPIQLGPTSTASTTPTARAPVNPTATLAPVPTAAAGEPSLGPEDAPVQLILYLDYDCEPCARFARILGEAQSRHPDQVRLTVRLFPLLDAHDKSALAAVAARAALEQGQFWQMHELMLTQRPEWSSLDPPAFAAWLREQAPALGLDQEQFASALESNELAAAVERDYNSALASGIPGSPFLLVNRQPYVLAPDAARVEAVIRLHLLQTQQYEQQPPQVIDPQSAYVALIATNQGALRLQLYASQAPAAVNSFAFLAAEGWYDDSAFHRVDPDRVAEAGDPTLTGLGHAGYHFGLETSPALSFDRAGMVAMDNDGPGTNSARFFITLSALPSLDGSYSIFGEVTSGMEILQSLAAREPLADLFDPPELQIESVEVTSP